MFNGTKISQEQVDKLLDEGVASFFDCPNEEQPELGFGSFFEAQSKARKDIVLVITNEGYFIRAREDLVKSKDEVFVGWVEDGEELPNFEDVFEVRKH